MRKRGTNFPHISELTSIIPPPNKYKKADKNGNPYFASRQVIGNYTKAKLINIVD